MQTQTLEVVTTPGYFHLPEISNSDLSWLKLKMLSNEEEKDFKDAYRIGSLIDAMITEPHLVDYFKLTLGEERYTTEEFELCKQMKRSFMADQFCNGLLTQCSGQVVFKGVLDFAYDDVSFALKMRCKYDLWSKLLWWGGDIKSTTATTQKQFEEAIRYFDYDRQRAVYMSLSGAGKDVLIGISKVNKKIFKVPITRESELFKSGVDKLNDLAYRWWYLFDGAA